MEKRIRIYFTALLAGAVIAITLWCFSAGISGNDFWWHIKTGEWIVDNGRAPEYDSFSWTGREKPIPWTAHEWLAEVILYRIYSICGSAGIFALSVFCSLALSFVILWRNRERLFDNFVFTAVFFCLFCVVSYNFCYGRPHIFGFLFLLAELFCLYDFYEREESRKIYWLPALTVVWSNVYGGSSNLAYLLPFLLLLCGLKEIRAGRLVSRKLSPGRRSILLGVTLADMAAVCVNPLGIRVFLFPYVLSSDSFHLSIVQEWFAPDAKLVGELIFYFLPVLLTAGAMLLSSKKVELFDFSVLLFFLYLFFRSKRFIILYYLASSFWAFRYVIPWKLQTEIKRYEKALVWCVCLIFGAMSLMNIRRMAERNAAGALIGREVPGEILDTVKADGPQRLFNDYDYGDILIYSDIPVFFDSRSDMYTRTELLREGISLLLLQQMSENAETAYVDVEAYVERYGFDGILIRTSRPLCSYLRGRPQSYELVMESDGCVYFRVR